MCSSDCPPLDELRVERYEPGVTITGFDCEKSSLNEFINTEQVADYDRTRLGFTRLVRHDTDLVAFFTLAPTALRQANFSGTEGETVAELDDVPHDVPARLVGRLAVDTQYQNRGIGRYVMERHVIAETLELTTVPFRLLLLHAHDDVVGFYERLGFTESTEVDGLIFFDLLNFA